MSERITLSGMLFPKVKSESAYIEDSTLKMDTNSRDLDVSVLALVKQFEVLNIKGRGANGEPIAKRFCERPSSSLLNPVLRWNFESKSRSSSKAPPAVQTVAPPKTKPIEQLEAWRRISLAMEDAKQRARRNPLCTPRPSQLGEGEAQEERQPAAAAIMEWVDNASVPSVIEMKQDEPERRSTTVRGAEKRKASEMDCEDEPVIAVQKSPSQHATSVAIVQMNETRPATGSTMLSSSVPADNMAEGSLTIPPPKPPRLFLYPYVVPSGTGDGNGGGAGSKPSAEQPAKNPFVYSEKDTGKSLTQSEKRQSKSRRVRHWLREKFFRRSVRAPAEHVKTYIYFDDVAPPDLGPPRTT